MTKQDFIKVSGKVILAANAAFYKEKGYQIEEPTEEEIKDAFPEYKIEAPEEPESDANPVEEQIEEPTEEATPEEAPKEKRKYTRKAN